VFFKFFAEIFVFVRVGKENFYRRHGFNY
jgi:hypothetical protein